MRFHLVSDAHIEFGKFSYKHTGGVPACDAILLAGDIGPGASGWVWAEKTYKNAGVPVLYTLGNHEGYSSKWSWDELEVHLRGKTSFVSLLQNDTYEFKNYKTVVLGTVLWTDFDLNSNTTVDMLRAPRVMNDYRWIKIGSNLITPRWVLDQNRISKQFLRDNIYKYKDEGWKVVVMTHHAPFVKSCDAFHESNNFRYGRENDVYYANCLDPYFPLPDVWVHGHTHNSVDYLVRDCRIISNPKGYSLRSGTPENKKFSTSLTFDV